jgi:hypothetical protein
MRSPMSGEVSVAFFVSPLRIEPRSLTPIQPRRVMYPPVVRIEPTGQEIVTWGEFTETRLLAVFRDAGVPMQRMRPAVERRDD